MSASTNKRSSKLGRKGDPRMHNAVAARTANPEITLLEALRAGGFDFPKEGGDDSTLVDSDNVTLGQRKNQLSRRLRFSKHSSDLGSVEGGTLRDDIPREIKSGSQVSGSNSSTQETKEDLLRGLVQQSPRSKLKRANSGLSILDYQPDILEDDMQEDVTTKMAKFHPQYAPLFPSIPREAPASAPAMVSAGHMPSPFSAHAQQFLAQQQNRVSGVAMSSLSSTAAGMGMSLEQLALTLSSTPNLLQVLAGSNDPDVKQELALNLFKTESRALLQKCMLLAGYDGSEVPESSATNLQLAIKAWEFEGARLDSMLGLGSVPLDLSRRQQNLSAVSALARDAAPPPESVSSATTVHVASAASKSQADQYGHHENVHKTHRPDHTEQHGHNHSHIHQTEKTTFVRDDAEEAHAQCFQGQHVHSLSGKCGHKPVVHKPEGGKAHIDFLVDGKIECYEDVRPIEPNRRDGKAFWPSRYRCADVGCASDDSGNPSHRDHESYSKEAKCIKCHFDDDCAFGAPKELPLSDLNLEGKEWNLDFFDDSRQDETLFGLIRLGENRVSEKD